jgi:hypothetical protein
VAQAAVREVLVAARETPEDASSVALAQVAVELEAIEEDLCMNQADDESLDLLEHELDELGFHPWDL